MDLNMPELLAMDLESAEFGAPPSRLAAEAYGRQYSLRDFSPPRSESHHRQHMLVKMRSFGTKDEYRRSSASRNRTVAHTKTIQGLCHNQLALPTGHPDDISHFRLGHEDKHLSMAGAKHSDPSAPAPVAMYDDSTSESSYGEAAPPSIRCRKQSVTTTAATSVESARCSSAMSHHKRAVTIMATATPAMERGHQESWMDFDADFTPNPYHHNLPGDGTSWETDSFVEVQHRHPDTSMAVRSHVHEKEGDITRDSASVTSVHIPKRRSSLSHRITITKAESSTHPGQQSIVTCHSPGKQGIPTTETTEECDFGAGRMAFPLPVLPVDLTAARASHNLSCQQSNYNGNSRSNSTQRHISPRGLVEMRTSHNALEVRESNKATSLTRCYNEDSNPNTAQFPVLHMDPNAVVTSHKASSQTSTYNENSRSNSTQHHILPRDLIEMRTSHNALEVRASNKATSLTSRYNEDSDPNAVMTSQKASSQTSTYNEKSRSNPTQFPITADNSSGQLATQKGLLKPPPLRHNSNMNSDMDSFSQNRQASSRQLLPTVPSLSTRSSINVETWLESSIQLGLGRVTPPPPCRETIATVGVPLPRALIDNLHIYVTGFPEVMLTPTCMVFETIRSHSRQMKRPGCSGAGGSAEGGAMKVIDEDVFRPDSVTFSRTGGKSSLRRWNPLKRLTLSSKASAPSPAFPSLYASYSRGNGLPPSPVSPADSTSTSLAPKTLSPEGQRIRRVFGPNAPGYLCEALYAHVLAYNYISALLPAKAPAPAATPSHAAAPARPNTPSSEMDDLSDIQPEKVPGRSGKAKRIPPKAATLLGLDAFPSGPAGESLRSRSQASLALNTGIAGSGRGPEPDPSVRILHSGLAGCIGLLVSTLRLVIGTETDVGAGDEEAKRRLDGEAKKAVDPVLLGALCEVVRCAEEVR